MLRACARTCAAVRRLSVTGSSSLTTRSFSMSLVPSGSSTCSQSPGSRASPAQRASSRVPRLDPSGGGGQNGLFD
eukprot:670935-Prorocentrum_minimum.AAC.1